MMPPATTDPMRKPWLPLLPKTGRDGATESSINFQAFEHYISLPAGERSLKRTAQDLNKSEKLMERWSSKFDWRRRALAWDQHLATIQAEPGKSRLARKPNCGRPGEKITARLTTSSVKRSQRK